jgi:hypothetical protein
MIMMDQSQRLAKPLGWGRREKSMIAALIACVVIASVALWASGATSGEKSAADCVSITFASTLGAAKVHTCGERARATCASPKAFPSALDQLRSECRRAGYPVGREG